jgi:hypothetical protein
MASPQVMLYETLLFLPLLLILAARGTLGNIHSESSCRD